MNDIHIFLVNCLDFSILQKREAIHTYKAAHILGTSYYRCHSQWLITHPSMTWVAHIINIKCDIYHQEQSFGAAASPTHWAVNILIIKEEEERRSWSACAHPNRNGDELEVCTEPQGLSDCRSTLGWVKSRQVAVLLRPYGDRNSDECANECRGAVQESLLASKTLHTNRSLEWNHITFLPAEQPVWQAMHEIFWPLWPLQV